MKTDAAITSKVLQSERRIRIGLTGLKRTATAPSAKTQTVLPATKDL
jgi:hypothetical protein